MQRFQALIYIGFSLVCITAAYMPLRRVSDYCLLDGDSVCMNCSVVGVCKRNSRGSFTVAPNSECYQSFICDNSIEPGTCLDSQSVSRSACQPTKSNRPSSYCERRGDIVCMDCETLGVCVPDLTGGLTVVSNSKCFDDFICDNTKQVGTCLKESENPQSVCRDDDRFHKNKGTKKISSGTGINIDESNKESHYTYPKNRCYTTRLLNDPMSFSCRSYLQCQEGEFIKMMCPEQSCFYEESQSCVRNSRRRPFIEQETEYFRPNSCPVCGLRKTDDSQCSGYTKCTGGRDEEKKCPGFYCFDEESCQCVPPKKINR